MKRLYRSKREKVLGGVFGGIAEYLEIDPVIVRLLGVVSIFFSGVGIIFYFIAWMIIPDNPSQQIIENASEKAREAVAPEKRNALPFALGVVLVIFGILWAADEFGIIHNFSFGFNIFPWRLFWPLLFIFFGVYLLASQTSVASRAKEVRNWAKDNRLSRSSTDKKLAGVCGGLARQWELDPTIVRLAFAFGIFISFGFGMILYIVLAIILPEDLQVTAQEASETKE